MWKACVDVWACVRSALLNARPAARVPPTSRPFRLPACRRRRPTGAPACNKRPVAPRPVHLAHVSHGAPASASRAFIMHSRPSGPLRRDVLALLTSAAATSPHQNDILSIASSELRVPTSTATSVRAIIARETAQVERLQAAHALPGYARGMAQAAPRIGCLRLTIGLSPNRHVCAVLGRLRHGEARGDEGDAEAGPDGPSRVHVRYR